MIFDLVIFTLRSNFILSHHQNKITPPKKEKGKRVKMRGKKLYATLTRYKLK